MTDGSRNFSSIIAEAIDKVESAIYLLVALFLIIMAIASFFIVARDLSGLVSGHMTIDTIYMSLNDLLVILILVELIQTVVVFIRSHRLDIRLIIAAGLTAMIRRVLVFGVEHIPVEEMAITAVLVVVLVAALYLLSVRKPEQQQQQREKQ
ncbi:phosphate-starvation-inducible PsiE family protein [Methanocella arvoryzae]|uniref:phosphate-starvation-inducible PsiE family protein n=1 Tax=Methanocella arvoryzae TaxID=1175445 RepID=UPI000321EEE9|nr:phosphate-starvation-inducible PsiE family protein [Methanocella arvoryzae]